MNPELQEMLQQTALLKKKAGISYGKPTYGAGVAIDVYWEEDIQVIKNQHGQEVVSKAFAIVDASIDVEAEDQLEYDGTNHQVLHVATFRDLDTQANHHKEVYV